MLSHMGFTCWISSDGIPSKTCSEESLGNVRSAWIASEAGKPFAVHWQDKSGKRIATSGHVFVDGKDVASAIIRPGRVEPVKRFGAKTRRGTVKPFVFSELSLTDDERLASPHDASLRNVGTIRVEISRVRLGGEVPFAGYDEAKNHGVVHERAKKAGAHCTKFREAKRVEKARTVGISTAPYDPNEPGPYVVFEFRYRGLETLKATGIVPNPRKRSNESNDDDEIIEIFSSDDERASSPTLLASSSRMSSPDGPSKKRVKTEPVEDDLPASSPPADTNDEPRTSPDDPQDFPTQKGRQAQLDSRQASEKFPSPTPAEPMNDSVIVKKEVEEDDDDDDGEEELDMLPGESEGTLSTEPSQNVLVEPFSFPIDYPPLSSSPGPEPLEEEEEEEFDELDG